MNADNHGGRHLGSLQIQSASGRARPRKRGSASRKAALFTAAFVASTAIYGHSMHADANSRGIGEDPTCIKYEETKRMLRSVSPSSYKRYSPAYSGSFGDRCKNPSQCRKELKRIYEERDAEIAKIKSISGKRIADAAGELATMLLGQWSGN